MKSFFLLIAWLLFFNMPGKTQEVNVTLHSIFNGNASVRYSVCGNGKPVLIANGGPGFSSWHMQEFAKTLSKKGFKVILFDQRGTGNSKVPAYDSLNITLDLVLEDMQKVIKQEVKGKAIVMGHSFGGILAMSFAAKYPAMVEKLVLCSSAGINLDFLNYFSDNIFQRLQLVSNDTVAIPVTVKEREEAFYAMLKANAPAYFYNKKNVAEFIDILTIPGSYSPEYNSLMWSDLFRTKYDLTKRFKGFKKPVLVIQGRQDILGDETAIRISQSIPGSKLVFMNRCGHVPWMDAPEDFLRELEMFLSQK